jgi:catechol 2,3-dioxygenase-like lactoylglutathione lyase family enzyme
MSTQPTLDFILINVSDIEASFRYFTETLGFETVPEENAPTFRYLKGAPGGIAFSLRQADGEHQTGQIELYFKTHDLEGLRAELVSKQVAASPILHPPFGTIFTVPSPNGETLTMMGA